MTPVAEAENPGIKNDIEQHALTTAGQAQALTVTNSEQHVLACERIKVIALLAKEVTEFFGPMKKKAHETWKEICAKENAALEPLTAAKAHLSRQIGSWEAAQERLRREEEERLAAIAKQEELDRALFEATQLEAQGEPELAKVVVESAKEAPAPVVVVPSTVQRSKGISARKIWKWKITNAALIPREYLMVDETKIGDVVRSMQDATNIPGIQAYPEDSVSVRGR